MTFSCAFLGCGINNHCGATQDRYKNQPHAWMLQTTHLAQQTLATLSPSGASKLEILWTETIVSV